MRRRRAVALAGVLAVLAFGALPATAGAASAPPSSPVPSTPVVRTAPPAPPANTRLPLSTGSVGALVLDTQKRLAWLGYSVTPSGRFDARTATAVAAFRTKFFLGSGTTVTTTVYTRLRSLTRSLGVLPRGCRSGLVICVDKTQKLVRLVRNGAVVVVTDARFGSDAHPTLEGTFRVYRKARDHTSSLYHTWMPLALFFSGGEAVHFSPYFQRDGYAGHSHGCVNVRDWTKQTRIFDAAPVGTRVVIYRS